MNLKPTGPIAALLLTVNGCNGGSDAGDGVATPPPPPPPVSAVGGGLWAGAVFWDPRNGFPGGALNVRALVAETGEFRMVLYEDIEQRFNAQSEHIFGTFDIDRSDITTLAGAIWAASAEGGNPTGDLWSNFGLSGDIEAGSEISGGFQANWTNSEERLGTFQWTYHSLYESPSSLDILQGTYTTTAESLTIDDQGAIFYQSSVTGCTGNGTAEIIDTDFNMYRVTIDVGSCTGTLIVRNGLTFTGVANIGVNNDLSGAFLNSTLEMAVNAEVPGPFGNGYIGWSLLVHKD